MFQCSFASTFSEFGRALTGLYLDYAGNLPLRVSTAALSSFDSNRTLLCCRPLTPPRPRSPSSAVNSINVIDSYFEGKLLIGIVATTGNVVRIEGNTIENMGGPAVIANQIGALTVRASQPSVSSLLDLC